MKKTLIYITSTFPYGGVTELSFIVPEIEALLQKFDNIIFIPEHLESEEPTYKLPPRADVDCRYALQRAKSIRAWGFKTITHPVFLRSVFHEGFKLFNKAKFLSHLHYFDDALKFSNWLQKNFNLTDSTLTFYTFWCHFNTTAFALLPKSMLPKVISRAHGYDIFDERVTFRSHFLRRLTLNRINALFPQSDDGVQYIRTHYPKVNAKIERRFLGCSKVFNTLNPVESSSNLVTFCTVARLHPVKRLPQTCELLCDIALHNQHKHIKWILIGEGSERAKIKKIIDNAPENLTVDMRGTLSNYQVHSVFATEPISAYLLLSKSEGTPISICEAMSYGIPIVATKVGGIPGMLLDGGGILIDKDIKSSKNINIINCFISNTNELNQMRQSAYVNWLNNFNANVLRKPFASELAQI